MTYQATRALSQVEVEERILKVTDALEERTGDYETLAIAAAELEADYRQEYAQALLDVIQASVLSTVAARESAATLATNSTHRHWLVAKATRDSCRESLASLREQLNALRTLAANIRGQV